MASIEPIKTCVTEQWIAKQYYNKDSAVIFESEYYIASHANPGYSPRISTWYWLKVTPQKAQMTCKTSYKSITLGLVLFFADSNKGLIFSNFS
jgi:hypothetical protein